MVLTGFDIISGKTPSYLKGKNLGVVCHAPSINREYAHITDFVASSSDLTLASIFGPQHGLFGQTQDNMIEWEGYIHPHFGVPVYSLYGKNRKPTGDMLKGIDCLLIDLQDVGARPYTYIWTMKYCMEACAELGIEVVVLDRPNPVSGLGIDGPVLKRDHFTFVGGAEIPLCHGMTIAEIAVWLNDIEGIGCNLRVEWMKGYDRNMMFNDTGLPWVLPSPNMPTPQTAIVYPGTVLIEALNISEGRGTTVPFELLGAPFMNSREVLSILDESDVGGCAFREHNFIPTFNKFAGEYCHGIQVHITGVKGFRPVRAASYIFESIIRSSGKMVKFNPPPYEYEYELMPFDILSGDPDLRKCLENGGSIKGETEKWEHESRLFLKRFGEISAY